MSDPGWEEVAGYFEDDGPLLDAYVFDVSMAEWQLAIDVIRSQGWTLEFLIGDSSSSLPDRVEAVFQHRDEQSNSVALRIRPAAGVLINTHFFAEDEIEFDLAPEEFRSQEDWDVLRSFLRIVGRAAGCPDAGEHAADPSDHLHAGRRSHHRCPPRATEPCTVLTGAVAGFPNVVRNRGGRPVETTRFRRHVHTNDSREAGDDARRRDR